MGMCLYGEDFEIKWMVGLVYVYVYSGQSFTVYEHVDSRTM